MLGIWLGLNQFDLAELMAIELIKSGLLDTIQDCGRFGFRSSGFGPSGPMDTTAFMTANVLVGNPPDAASIEISFPSPILKFHSDTVIAITGGDFEPRLNGEVIPLWSPVPIGSGDRLSFGRLTFGRFAYIAVSGGITTTRVLGSSSMNPTLPTSSSLTRLRKGQLIETGERYSNVSGRVSASNSLRPRYSRAPTLRVIDGPEWDFLTRDSRDAFEDLDFTVTNDSDRMGFRVSGSLALEPRSMELVSSPVTFGTVQLPPDGKPIVLMADHQTTGGYPRIANVIAADLPLLSQLQPRMAFGFKRVSPDHAVELLEERDRDLKMLSLAIGQALR